MPDGPRAGSIPVELSLRFRDRLVIDAGVSVVHQPVRAEFPVLVAMGAEPIARIVMPFIRKPHCDATAVERPELLDETVVVLFLPFPGEKGDNGRATLQEFSSVSPPAIGGIGEGDFFGIAGIPSILREAHLLDSSFARKRWQRRTQLRGGGWRRIGCV